ncbi:MAG: type I-F CRISPR-associated endonuclease Cas1f [Campylobacterota bacterium]|nr:type I-F CRISPR-associated endonuclease Cas1f [Campylobacterota bacterium]
MNYKDNKIMLSKRGYIFLVEHSRVKVENGTLVYLKAENGMYKSYNIPHINTSLIMIGEGSSITRDAAAIISDSGTLLMFVGGGGSPVHSCGDLSFSVISPVSEYRPPEYMQNWAKIFFDEDIRLKAAKDFMNYRVENIIYYYKKIDFIREMGVALAEDDEKIIEYRKKIKNATNTNELLLSEAWFTKFLYATFARTIKLNSFTREQGKKSDANDVDIVNGMLDHGNYIIYGLGSVTLHGLGISYAFPLLHGKTRRGALVFDVADLVKDAICLPLTFYSAINGHKDNEFRRSLIFNINKYKVLDRLFLQVKETATKDFNA